jgi:cystathionine beta-lyase/cystathionine gamma-synthase
MPDASKDDWMAQRAARIQARAHSDGYSEKTHLIHGRFQATCWDYKHHVVPPMSSSVTYRLESSGRGGQGFRDFSQELADDAEPIYIYDRLDEPTRSMLEQTLAYAEGAPCGVAFASGMSAISAALCTCAQAGQHILCHNVLYGCTFSLLRNWLPRFGIESTAVDFRQPEAWLAQVRPETRVVYFETPVNPDLHLIDIAQVSDHVRQLNAQRPADQRIRVIVDNTFCTAHGQRPLEWGADVVVASLTKSVGGFGTDLGGVVLAPLELHAELLGFRKDFGGVLSPKNAWPILVYGLPTLSIRLRQQQNTALRLAQFLEGDPRVARVSYPGLDSFPQGELARRQMRDYEGQFAPGTLIYFELHEADSRPGLRGRRFIDFIAENSYAITMAVSLGQVKTLIEHPYSMTHAAITSHAEDPHLIHPAGIRLSVGLEKGDDLIRDLRAALQASCSAE